MEKVEYNLRLLKSKMALFGDTYEKLAEYLGVNIVTVSNKLTKFPTAQFNQIEIGKIIARYHLTAEETMDIFFGWVGELDDEC